MNIAFLGAGAWGTAMAAHLHDGRHQIVLWDHDTANLLLMARARRNEKYLPGVDVPGDWRVEADAAKACEGSECVVVAVPSRALREATRVLADFSGIVVSLTKGIECQTLMTMSGVLRENAPNSRVVAVSGPTFALEVARGIPTAAVAASGDPSAAQAVQSLLHRRTFRVYTSADLVGVELGGALKNVMAIAAGVCDGLGFGDNSKAALVTRALAEIRRLGVCHGARTETFAGLSGLGDLVVTCFSTLSRNRALGERLGRGENLADILASSVSVAEGYPTAQAAWHMARKHDVPTPIIDEVYAMLYEGKAVADAVRDLTNRDSKAED